MAIIRDIVNMPQPTSTQAWNDAVSASAVDKSVKSVMFCPGEESWFSYKRTGPSSKDQSQSRWQECVLFCDLTVDKGGCMTF